MPRSRLQFEIATRLRDIRRSRRIKQGALANVIGYSPKTLSKWERGATHPNLLKLHDWCGGLGVRLEVVE